MNRRSVLRLAIGASAFGLAFLVPDGARSAAPDRLPARKPPAPGNLPMIVVDAGHGGRDPGAVGARGTLEKDITLDLALSLAGFLEGSGRVRVHLTRESDVYLPLGERVDIARGKAADLFLSLHADSAPNRQARGLSAYTLSEKGSDDFARALAHQENMADRFGGVDISKADPNVAAILMDLRLRHTHDAAIQAKNSLVAGAGRTLRLLDNPKRSANFAVLKAPDIPSVLVETGFLSNRQDEELLRDRSHRRRIAQVLAGELAEVVTSAPFA